MTDCGGYSGRERALIQIPPRQSSSHSSAVPGGRVRGDGRRLTRRTAGKEFSYFLTHPGDQFAVLFMSPRNAGGSGFRAVPGVFRTLLFRFLQSGLLHQNALPFIASARAAEAHDNGGAFAITAGSPCQSSIAGREILEIVKPRTWQAQRLFRLHKKKAASGKLGAAFRTRGVPQNINDYRLRRVVQFLLEPLLFALGQGGRKVVSAIVLLDVGIPALAKLQVHNACARPAHVFEFHWA